MSFRGILHFLGFNFTAFDVPDLQMGLEISMGSTDVRCRHRIVDVRRSIPE